MTTSRAFWNCSASRRTRRGAGFTLVEALLACALLAAAIVPLMRALGNNRRAAQALEALARRVVADGDQAARAAADAEAARPAGQSPSAAR